GIAFANTSGTSTATFNSAQFGAGKISTSAAITGTGATNALAVNMASGGSLNLSAWTFTNWTSGADTITVTGSTGIESIVGSSQNDILAVAAGGVQSGDLYDGGGGTNTLQVTSGAVDFSTITQDATHGLHNIAALAFSGAGPATATLNGLTQLGSGLVSSTATVTGSGQADTLQFSQSAGGSLNLSGLQFTNWTSRADTVHNFATSGIDTYVGTSQDDTFVFGAGTVNAGDSFNGGSGNDTLQVGSTAGPTSVSFVPATLTSIEGLKFVNTSGTSSASFTASQIGAQLSSTALISGAAGDQSININTNGASQSINLSGWSFANWTSGSDAINLVLNAGGVTTIVGSSQADTLVFNGNGPVVAGSKFDGGGGSDVIQVNTSIDFSSAASDGVNGFLNMEGITFGGTSTATFSSAQFGAGKISNAL